MRYLIEGGKKLIGEVQISGNKNSVFPCVAAALLTDQEVVLENVPQIRDVEILVQILKDLGVKVSLDKNVLTINAEGLRKYSLADGLAIKLRGSIVLVGGLLGRMGKVSFHHPGGDIIGKRSIETHLLGFKSLGATVKKDDLNFSVHYADKLPSEDVNIFLPEASVTATENIILASVLGKRVVILRNCTKEPHVVDLCKMLVQMGVSIEGIGTDTLIITSSERLNGTRFRIGADPIEIGTYAIAAAITNGKITLSGVDSTDFDPMFCVLERMGVKIEKKQEQLVCFTDLLKSISKIQTNIWPGFPTDLMSVAVVLATQAKGITLCHDWMYESRMFFVDKLIAMGAHITLADPHRVLVYGPAGLKARELETPDIRAGMALVLAALVAKGKSIINRAELIERGYEDVVGKLRSLGADIERKE
ncbi:UDP-N-acetylglucosamine 1-carboxyvinyltransferase [Candidatus Daviesbacteria bacterium]|nr:UDP-N-acetylglucosamine 1-carboxyvinyltransferase [Candidatus Daviesbacteria bacterium]